MVCASRRSRSAQVSALRRLSEAVRSAGQPGSPSLASRMAAVPRMVKASVAGDYDGVSPVRLAALAAAAAYIVSPVDLIPEALLPVVGLADDAVVLAWFAGALVQDTDDFLAWERGRGPTVQGQRVR